MKATTTHFQVGNGDMRRGAASPLFRAQGHAIDGDRILILGEDVEGKTGDLTQILVTAGSPFSRICGVTDSSFKGLLLASSDDEADVLSKNNPRLYTH